MKISEILKNKYGVDTIYIKRNNVSSTEIRKRAHDIYEMTNKK